MLRLVRQSSKTDRGSMAVELALVLPILIMLTFAIIQYGILMNATAALSNISREAARFEAVHGTETPITTMDTAMKTYASNVCNGTPIPPADITIGTPVIKRGSTTLTAGATRLAGDTVTVTITYNLRKKIFMSTGFAGMPGVSNSMSKSTTMIIE